MATSGAHKCPKSEKLDEAQALAKSCAGRPDFLPCDGLSICATHSHGKCFKLHWCCHLGWCHCKYVYQPMTNVCQLPSTAVPPVGSEYGGTIDLSASLAERFLKLAPSFKSPPHLESPKYCIIADLFVDDYVVKRINGKMCYVQPQHMPIKGPKMDHCSSPSSSEDSGINALGLHYLESCEDETDEDDDLSSDGNSSPSSLWDQDDCSLLSPSKSMIEIIEKIETTV
uniref:Chromosome 3 open reading frame 70 n=1 Tax=Oryzias latipes TaxID=8090 RepID=H2MPG1_ORYLA